MPSPPFDRDPSFGENGSRDLKNLDATSGFESMPKLDETSASDASTKNEPSKKSSKSKQPRKVGGYELGELLGQGGMGRVFRAEDSTGRLVALKLLSPDLARSPEALARFKQEGLIASQLNHPHCVFVHHVDEDAGTPFIAMELMTGQTLKDLVQKQGPLACDEAVRLILQCIDGLIEAHALGMIHRDIKPANCYLDDDGNVKVGDFGLARSLVSDSELTQTGAFLGTPLFASPEQLLGQSIDTRSDIYSLTATLYYLLAGKAPFESPHAAQVIARIASSDPPSFKSVGISVPASVEQIVMKGLSRDASKRYASFASMRSELQATIQPTSEPATLTRRCVAWVADYFLMTSVAAAAMISVFSARDLSEDPLFANIIGIVVVFLYYLLTESVFGTSIGKAAMRISVVDAATGGRAKFVGNLIRSTFFVANSSALYILLKLLIPDEQATLKTLAFTVSFLGSLVILYSTWRPTKRRQFLHDWLSGTECRTRSGALSTSISPLKLPNWNLPVKATESENASAPKLLGRFTISAEIDIEQHESGIRWWMGQDPQLERTIWVACVEDKSIEFDEAQKQKPKSMRLRLIEEGVEEGYRWFAYVAPEGVPIGECIRHGVQFPWPIVRSVLFEYVGSKFKSDSNSQPPILDGAAATVDAERVWVDQAGRFASVDFQVNPSAKPELHPQGTPLTFVQSLATLGLPARHRLRRKVTSRAASRALARSVPAIQELPPLRALRLLETIASPKQLVSDAVLAKDLASIDKNSHAVTSSIRFFASAVSLGLMSPLIFLGMIVLLMPSIILVIELYREVRCLKTLSAWSSEPEVYEDRWKETPQGSRETWTTESNQKAILEALDLQSSRLETATQNLGMLERFITKSIPMVGDSLSNPPIHGPAPKKQTFEKDEQDGDGTTEVKINFGNRPIGQVNFGNEVVDQKLRSKILTSVERSKALPAPESHFPDGLIVLLGILGCVVWTTITFGGIVQYFTSTCIMSRDGRRLGFVRSFWRAMALYLPLALLASAIAYCNYLGFEYLWLGTQFKRAIVIVPIAYLGATLILSRRTPLDLVSGTAMVPR